MTRDPHRYINTNVYDWPAAADDWNGNINVCCTVETVRTVKTLFDQDTCNPKTLEEAKHEAAEASKTCAFSQLWYGEGHYVFTDGREER